MDVNEKSSLEAEVSRLRAEVQGNRAARLHNEHVAFCDGLVGIRSGWREAVIANLDHLAALPVAVEFGEGDDKALLLDAFKAMLSSLPPPVMFGEFATNDRAATGAALRSFTVPSGCDVDPAALATHEKAVRHQKANGGSYEDAIKAVA